MDISGLSFELANFVMRFNNLNNAKISRDSLLNLYPDLQPEHLEIGPLLAVRYPAHKIEIYLFLAENRVEVKTPEPRDEDWAELPKMAYKVFHAITGVSLTAFGFNYFSNVPAPNDKDGDQFLIGKFDTSLKPLAEQVQGKIFSFASNIRYSKNEEKYELNIGTRPDNAKLLSLRLNVHYNTTTLPVEEKLIGEYSKQKDNFVNTLKRLFE